MPRRSVFDLSVSTRPGASEVVGRREKQKTKNSEGARGPGMKKQKLTPLAPSPPLGQVVGETLGSGPDVATWVNDGLVMCRHVMTGVDLCGSVCLLIGHQNALESAYLRAHKPENRLKSLCFCFLRRGPGPSKVAGGKVLTERSKTLRPVLRGRRKAKNIFMC